MKKRVLILTASAAVMLATHAFAGGDAAAGKNKSAVCSACHGADGNSASPTFPKLAGQNAGYIVQELTRFKSGVRQNPIMSVQAKTLSDQDMQDLAAWFSSQKVQPGQSNPSLVKAGERLFRGGDADHGVPACLACHSPDGAGNAPAGYPALAGQHADYVVAQLQAFAAGTRKSPMMGPIASRLTPDQMQAVASYVEGLHGTQP